MISSFDDPSHLIAQGNALEDAGELAAALRLYSRAVAISPDLARAHLNCGNAYMAMGDLDAAEKAYGNAIAIDPSYGSAHINMGHLYRRTGKQELAREAYERGLAHAPANAHAYAALGSLLVEQQDFDRAIDCFRSALTYDPSLDEAQLRLLSVLISKRDFEEASRHLGSIVGEQRTGSPTLYAMGCLLHTQSRFGDARLAFRAALAVDPTHAQAACNLGLVELALGDFESAVSVLERAIAIDPLLAEAHSNLGNVLRKLGRSAEAIASFERAAKLRPDAFEPQLNLGTILQEGGDLAAAAKRFSRALEIRNDSDVAQTGLLFCMSHDEAVSPKRLFDAHIAFGTRLEAAVEAVHHPTPDLEHSERVLRIAYVSADFCNHPVSNFFEPLLDHLARRNDLLLYAYSNQESDDEVTHRLRRKFSHWRDIRHIGDEEVVEIVRRDQIDILVELSGHTAGHRLAALARKPAPIQASHIGYPGTTGLRAMDYYFTDPNFLPFESFSPYFIEKLVHLPANVPFKPAHAMPAIAPLPALSRGYITFGSFNRLSKLRPSVVALWSRLLHATPGSRMLLAAMPRSGEYNPVPAWFAEHGIDAHRLRVYPRADFDTYLALHGYVDVALDTFPYSGGTTTTYATLMGVPTLTLAGSTPPGRQTAALLGCLGLHEFVTDTPEAFVRIGTAHTTDLPRLSALRAELRSRYLDSPAGHPDVIASALARAFRAMWRRHCAGLPPVGFVA